MAIEIREVVIRMTVDTPPPGAGRDIPDTDLQALRRQIMEACEERMRTLLSRRSLDR